MVWLLDQFIGLRNTSDYMCTRLYQEDRGWPQDEECGARCLSGEQSHHHCFVAK